MRWVSVSAALAGLALLLLVLLAPGAGARATGIQDAAAALKQGPVYVHPDAADQLSAAQADALAQKIENADKPVFVAVLPDTSEFPEQNLLRNLRTQTGVTGLYAVRLGDAFDAGADRSVMSRDAVQNLVTAVDQPGVDANTELNNFVDQALPTVGGSAPASWSGGSASDSDGVPVGGLVTLGAVLVAGGAGAYAVVRRNRRRKEEEEREALDKLRVVVDEDITSFGEELERLDFHPAEKNATEAMRGDYERSLDAYDRAKSLMGSARHPHDVREVTQQLEDGRWSLAVLGARRENRPVPERRPPCFFDPRHGPSTDEREWTPEEGAARTVPVCADCAAQLDTAQQPQARMVGGRTYWNAGESVVAYIEGYWTNATPFPAPSYQASRRSLRERRAARRPGRRFRVMADSLERGVADAGRDFSSSSTGSGSGRSRSGFSSRRRSSGGGSSRRSSRRSGGSRGF